MCRHKETISRLQKRHSLQQFGEIGWPPEIPPSLQQGTKKRCIWSAGACPRFFLREQPMRQAIPALRDTQGGPVFAPFPLETLLDYWRLVEQSTVTYLPALDDRELKRIVTVDDRPGKRYMVDGVLWNVIIHEARHVAQISVLLRTQGIAPPFLDLVKYLPVSSA
jgi:hypothetical protein